jgi:lysophospholipase L1-like esterase
VTACAFDAEHKVPVNIDICMKKTVVIMGDSWACGEWGWNAQDQYGVLHTGIQHYLETAGYTVHNLARGGQSNLRSVDALLTAGFQPAEVMVLWVLTDPIRDILPTKIARSLPAFLSQRNELMRLQLDRVQSWRIGMIGGPAAVPNWVTAEFPMTQVIVPDWVDWLCPGQGGVHSLGLGRTWQYRNPLPDLMTYFEQQEQNRADWLYRARYVGDSVQNRYWWPDGVHPNRLAHQRITAELILPYLDH